MSARKRGRPAARTIYCYFQRDPLAELHARRLPLYVPSPKEMQRSFNPPR